MKKGQDTQINSRVEALRGWQPCRGIGGRLGLESVAALPWNRWQACYGISGRFGVEYAAFQV